MTNRTIFKVRQISKLVALAMVGVAASSYAHADDNGDVDLGAIGSAKGADQSIEVFAKKGTAASAAPTQVNLSATEPQAIISRAFIENSVAPTADFATISLVAPSVSAAPSPNGPGLADSKPVLRGFTDGQYNVTWDGIPFADTNDPTHHSTAYFPAAVIGGVVIERGPGNASNLGQATYGGSVNLLSKKPSQEQSTEVYASYGSWQTELFGVAYESGRKEANDATLQLNVQQIRANGYLQYSDDKETNFVLKYQKRVGDNTTATLFGSYNIGFQYKNDGTGQGETLNQEIALGKSFAGLENDPTTMGYYKYNNQDKKTNLEYLKLQSDWGGGFETDNTLYTYGYDNHTASGLDATGFLGYGQPVDPNAKTNTGSFGSGYEKVKLKSGVPGYDKLNAYQVIGDIFKATEQFQTGLLRFGFWSESAQTTRHNFAWDASTETYISDFNTYGVKVNQNSSFYNFQPFTEFEWAATDSTTVTPGYRWTDFTRVSNAPVGYTSGGKAYPANYSETYIKSLPFLTVNQRFGSHDSAYFQYAQGIQIPALADLQTAAPINIPAPQTTTNYQLGYVHSSDTWLFDADVYHIHINHYQQLENVGAGNANNTLFVDVGGATYKGVEAAATLFVGSGLSVYLNGSSNQATYDAGNGAVGGSTGDVIGVPHSTYAAGLLFNDGPWNASAVFKEIGAQTTGAVIPANGVGASPTELAAFGNLDINAAYTIKDVGFFHKVKIQASAYNVLNSQKATSYAQGTVGNPGTDFYTWQAPRSYMLTLRGYF